SNTSPGPEQLIYHNDAGPRITAGEKFAKDAEARGKSRLNSNSQTSPGLARSNNGVSETSGIQGNSEANTGFVPRSNSSFSNAPVTRSDAWSQFQGMGMMLLFTSILNGSIFERGEKIVDNTKSLFSSITGDAEEKTNETSESTQQPKQEVQVLAASPEAKPVVIELGDSVLTLTPKASLASEDSLESKPVALETDALVLETVALDKEVECLAHQAMGTSSMSDVEKILKTAEETHL
ncbi:MAG: hypothetical protein ACO3LE_10695, partial [Bdellovibrionota bacterium]